MRERTKETQSMTRFHREALLLLARWRKSAWTMLGTAFVSFAAGSLISSHLTHLQEVKAESNRVFELDIYHAVPGKVPALAERFRSASKLQTQHGLHGVGYWIPQDSPAFVDTFVYLIAHDSQEDAERNWHAFHADPAFQEYLKSEQSEKLIQGVDRTYMLPTDYSLLK
jgi:NIPSNAP protein